MSGHEHPRTIAIVTDVDPTGFLSSLAHAMDGQVVGQEPVGLTMTATCGGAPITVTVVTPSTLTRSTARRLTVVSDDDVAGTPTRGDHLDAGIFLVSATTPMSDALIDAWDACDDLGMPRAIAITDIDSPAAETESTIEECQEALGDLVPVLAVDLPVLGDDDVPIGRIDLLTADIIDYSPGRPVRSAGQSEHLRLIADERSWLIEAIVAETEREDVVAAYLSGETIDPGDLVAEYFSLVARGRLHPVLMCAQRPSGLGMDAIADLIDRGFPATVRARP